MINVLYSSLDVCFCFMFPQTKYKYDLLLLGKITLYFIYPFILLLSYVFLYHLNVHCISYIHSYIHREVSLFGRINYCHIVIVSYCHKLLSGNNSSGQLMNTLLLYNVGKVIFSATLDKFEDV